MIELTPEDRELIIRMDENIKIIKQQLEGGQLLFKEMDKRLDCVEKEVNTIKASNSGIWRGASTLAVIVVGVLNLLLLISTHKV